MRKSMMWQGGRRLGGRHGGRGRQRARGAAAVELALLLAPLLLIVLATAELGRAMHHFNTLGKGVRDATRHLSQFGTADEVVQQARCLAVHGSVDCSGRPLLPGLSTALVSVCDAQRCPATHAAQSTGLGAMALVSVEIAGFRFAPVLPGTWPAFDFRPVAVTMRAPL